MEQNETYLTSSLIPSLKLKVESRQEKLVSGTNIKTVNGQSLLGSGDIEVVTTLYDTTGENTDGAMTQKATTDAIDAAVADFASSETVTNLQTALTAETAARTQADTAINKTLTDQGADIESLLGYSEKVVQVDTAVGAPDASTVNIIKTTGAINSNDTNEATLPLPVANSAQAGVINPAIYDTIQNNATQIEVMLTGSVLIDGLSATVSQTQLTDAWKQETGLEDLINGARIYDKANGKVWTYYSNASEWEPADIVNPEIDINVFTNTQAGIILGSATGDGKLFAEADGTGSVLGWDVVKSDISTNTSSITTLQTGKQDKLESGTNLKTVNGETLLGSGDVTIPGPTAMTVQEFLEAWEAA